MPKLKSHSGAKKRFRKSKGGKWLHRKAGRRHLLTGMSSKRSRSLGNAKVAEPTSSEGKLLKSYLPHN